MCQSLGPRKFLETSEVENIKPITMVSAWTSLLFQGPGWMVIFSKISPPWKIWQTLGFPGLLLNPHVIQNGTSSFEVSQNDGEAGNTWKKDRYPYAEICWPQKIVSNSGIVIELALFMPLLWKGPCSHIKNGGGGQPRSKNRSRGPRPGSCVAKGCKTIRRHADRWSTW